MLGSAPTRNREAEVLERIEQIAESIEYRAPEHKDEFRAEIITSIRRVIREFRTSQPKGSDA